ncbi:MAG: C25 family cysteine peptidase [Polyangiaceae bacterium]|nr:C25 family cysteine peptidase [Polyangiaceae bacterium]
MNLTADDPEGRELQLKGCDLEVKGPSSLNLDLSLVTSDDLQLVLEAGDYEVKLDGDCFFETTEESEPEILPAQLLSDRVQKATVKPEQVSQVTFAFLVQNQEVILDTGDLDVDFQVFFENCKEGEKRAISCSKEGMLGDSTLVCQNGKFVEDGQGCVVSTTPPTAAENTVALCLDQSDNDDDGLVDCQDPDCETPLKAAGLSGDLCAATQRRWVGFDGAKEGEPASAVLNTEESKGSRMVFDVAMTGYFTELRAAPHGEIFEKISVPGAARGRDAGTPDLPSIQFDVGVPLGRDFGDDVKFQVQTIKTEDVEGANIWPVVYPSTDTRGAPDSSPEVFVQDQKVYQSSEFPVSRREGVVRGLNLKNGKTVGQVRVPLASLDPSAQKLSLVTKARIILLVPGQYETQPPVSREKFREFEIGLINWRLIKEFYPWSPIFCDRYLAIYPDDSYEAALRPLLSQKRRQGMFVKKTEMSEIESTYGLGCGAIRATIADFEATTPDYCDTYALLVGDTDTIPLCTAPTGDPTDDLYASTDGDDLDEEVYLGRLSVNDPTDLEHQVSKILAYSDSPALFFDYGSSLLWAHKEGAPGKYVGAHETVRTTAYAVSPTFTAHYGSVAGTTDLNVVSMVNNGMGIVAYRGHGSSSSTATGWNQTSEYFNDIDVAMLENPMNKSPVLWSFACTNSKLTQEDSISELWMSMTDTLDNPVGSVSAYGATEPSYTDQNHILDQWMFRAVFDEGLVRQSHAIERAEAQMGAIVGSSNAWLYLLLGDPAMDIRRSYVPLPIISWRLRPEICLSAICEVSGVIQDELKKPLPFARISLVVGADTENPQQFSVYADQNGEFSLQLPELSEPSLDVFVRSDEGASLQQAFALN